MSVHSKRKPYRKPEHLPGVFDFIVHHCERMASAEGGVQFAEKLDEELLSLQAAPRFSAVLSSFFELEEDLAEVDEVLLHPPRALGDRAIHAIMRAKFHAEISVKETARGVVRCEARLQELCDLIHIDK